MAMCHIRAHGGVVTIDGLRLTGGAGRVEGNVAVRGGELTGKLRGEEMTWIGSPAC